MKSTAIAPSNIAFIKFWGKKNDELRLPANGSISMNLSNLTTVTTVEFDKYLKSDQIQINNIKENQESSRCSTHLSRVRKLANINVFAKVISKNNFPTASGLASSASGFAALTLAASNAAGLKLSEKELSILARQGSGSASRSIPDGFVEWLDSETSEESYSISLHLPEFWDIADVVAIISTDNKKVPTSQGHKYASSSIFYQSRIPNIKNKIILLKKYLREKNFIEFGTILEHETLEMHAVMMTQTPSLIYWEPATLELIKIVMDWRDAGLQVFFTIDAGPQVHLICEKKNIAEVEKLLRKIKEVKQVIINYPSKGARLTNSHLF